MKAQMSTLHAEVPTDGSRPPDGSLGLRTQIAMAWSACAVLGAVAISVIGRADFVRLIVPLSLMGFYVWYGTRFEGRNTPRFADSVYFLGFLWTLWALIDALVIH